MTHQRLETLAWSPKEPAGCLKASRFWMWADSVCSWASEALLDMFPRSRGANRAIAVAKLANITNAKHKLNDIKSKLRILNK